MNEPTTDAGHKVIQQLEMDLSPQVKAKGIYPYPMVVYTARGFDLVSTRGTVSEVYDYFCKACSHPEVKAAVFGIDRTSPEEMKTELKDVLSIVLYEKPPFALYETVRARECFKFGIIEYKHKPRVLRKINWEHTKWNNQIRTELYSFIPDCWFGDQQYIERVPNKILSVN